MKNIPKERYALAVRIASVRRYWPETLLAVVAAYFFVRDLGSFPAAGTDDSLFMIVARTLANGEGYAIPILAESWEYPSFLGVGPTVILPSALFLKLFGVSVAIARFPMIIYLAATAIALYTATLQWAGRKDALLATALLITLSAFVNTGKPLLGEIPGFLFLFLSIMSVDRAMRSTKWAVIGGIAGGLAVITKFTYAALFPALAVAIVCEWILHRRPSAWKLALMGIITAAVYAPWFLVERLHGPGIIEEAILYLSGNLRPDTVLFHVVRRTPEVLLRIPFLAFVVTFVLGMIGLWRSSLRLSQALKICITVLIAIYVLYYLDLYGWYRHLIAAHLLLIPFVPAGARKVLGMRTGAVLIAVIILAQGWWQLTYRGSSRSTTGTEMAAYVEEHFTGKSLVVQQPEVYAILSWHPEWLHRLPDMIATTIPPELNEIPASHASAPLLRKVSSDADIPPCRRSENIIGSYHLQYPIVPCIE